MNNIEKLLKKFPNKDWGDRYSYVEWKVSLKFIEDNPDLFEWDWSKISWKIDDNIDFLLKHLDKPLKWGGYGGVTNNMSLKNILKNPDLNWDWFMVSKDENLTMGMIREFLDKKWDFSEISKHISWEDIVSNPKISWNWKNVSENPNITMEIIENNPERDWDYENMSENPNLTVEFIEKHSDEPWDWSKILDNDFEEYFYDCYEENETIDEYYKKYPYVVKQRTKKIREIQEILKSLPICDDIASIISDFTVDWDLGTRHRL